MAHTQNPPPPPKRQLYVLIVDDDEIYREMLIAWLIREGHRTCHAWDVTGAKKLLRSEPDLDLVILDWSLKGENNGLEVAAEVKRRIPVFMASGFTREQMRDREENSLGGITLFFEKGAVGFIHDLVAQTRGIARVLGRENAGPNGDARVETPPQPLELK